MKYDAVIVASGKGVRANLGYNKAFYVMKDGSSVLMHTVSVFKCDADCERIIIVTNKEYMNRIPEDEKIILVEGGQERKDSVRNGLNKVESEYVLIHDGARPFLHPEALEEVKEKVTEAGAVVLGHMAFDTVKIVNDGIVEKTIDRNTVFMAETPQAFKSELIKDAYARCADIIFTDDASLAESLGIKVHIVIDRFDNHKLTSEEDFRDL